MNILLINHYAGSIYHGMEFRPYYLAREWVRHGHRVHIVAASCSHLRQQAPPASAASLLEEDIDGIHYLWLRTPPYRGNGAARVRNMLAFVARLWREGPRLARMLAPDTVIASSTYPLDIWPAHRIARLAGASLVHEVHDLWPLSPIELGGHSRRHPFIMLLQAAENHACRHADAIVSILPKVREHLEARGMAPHKLHIIPNGVDPSEWPAPTVPATAAMTRCTPTLATARLASAAATPATAVRTSVETAVETIVETVADADTPSSEAASSTSTSRPTAPEAAALPLALAALLARLRGNGHAIVGYAGSHGKANALDTLLDAAVLLHGHPLAFVLVGDGPEKEGLRQRALRLGLTHVHFAAPVAKRYIPALLSHIDIAFLGWRRQPLYRFGIAPNKLLDYMMAGRAVLHAVDAGNDPVCDAGCGTSVTPDDPEALAQGLLYLLELGPERRRALGERGRQYALAHLTYPIMAQRFLNILAQEVTHG